MQESYGRGGMYNCNLLSWGDYYWNTQKYTKIIFQKMFTETKAHSKAIDMELRRLEVAQANQHVTYLTQYMPDNFMARGGEYCLCTT